MTNAESAAKEIQAKYNFMSLGNERETIAEISAIIQKHCPENVWVEGPPKEEGLYQFTPFNETEPRLVGQWAQMYTDIPVQMYSLGGNGRVYKADEIVRHSTIHLPNLG